MYHIYVNRPTNEAYVTTPYVDLQDIRKEGWLYSSETNTIYVAAVCYDSTGHNEIMSEHAFFEFFYMPNSSVTWKVTFDLNYSGSTPSEITVPNGERVAALTVSRSGYVFVGWYRDAACMVEAEFEDGISTFYITANITLYAGWRSGEHLCQHVCPECGKCQDSACDNAVCSDKCPGHSNVPQHECTSVCPVCGNCQNWTCGNPVCSNKCPGHELPQHQCSNACPECGKCQDLMCGDPACADKCPGHSNAAAVLCINNSIEINLVRNTDSTEEEYFIIGMYLHQGDVFEVTLHGNPVYYHSDGDCFGTVEFDGYYNIYVNADYVFVEFPRIYSVVVNGDYANAVQMTLDEEDYGFPELLAEYSCTVNLHTGDCVSVVDNVRNQYNWFEITCSFTGMAEVSGEYTFYLKFYSDGGSSIWVSVPQVPQQQGVWLCVDDNDPIEFVENPNQQDEYMLLQVELSAGQNVIVTVNGNAVGRHPSCKFTGTVALDGKYDFYASEEQFWVTSWYALVVDDQVVAEFQSDNEHDFSGVEAVYVASAQLKIGSAVHVQASYGNEVYIYENYDFGGYAGINGLHTFYLKIYDNGNIGVWLDIVPEREWQLYFFNNRWDDDWDTVYAYCYDSSTYETNAEFPGEEMTSLGNGWFVLNSSSSADRVIFSGRPGYVSEDLALQFDDDVAYYNYNGVTELRPSSSEAYLESISLSVTLAEQFDPYTFAYTATVPYQTDFITIDATANQGSSLYLNEYPFHFIQTCSLMVGVNVVEITVLAADALSMRTYTLTITREREELASDAGVRSILCDGNSYNHIVQETTYGYSVYFDNVPSYTESVYVSVQANSVGAQVQGAGMWYLSIGENIKQVTVTSADGYNTMTYTLHVTLPDAGGDNTLMMLSVKCGTWEMMRDDNAFNTYKNAYYLNIPYDVQKITVCATPSSNNAIISGDIGEVSFAGDSKLLVITVTAENGAQREYMVTITRLEPSRDNTLHALSIFGFDELALDPEFDPEETTYDIVESIPYSTPSLIVDYTADQFAQVSVTGADSLQVGAGVINIVVTPQDPTISAKTYTIMYIRESASTDATLAALSVEGYDLSPAFDKNRLN